MRKGVGGYKMKCPLGTETPLPLGLTQDSSTGWLLGDSSQPVTEGNWEFAGQITAPLTSVDVGKTALRQTKSCRQKTSVLKGFGREGGSGASDLCADMVMARVVW